MNIKNYHRLRNDFIFLSSTVIISVICILIANIRQPQGRYAEIFVNGKSVGRYPLSFNTEIDIYSGDSSEHINVIVIRNGKVSVKASDCHDKICTEYKPISKCEESIICLPHKLVITIKP